MSPPTKEIKFTYREELRELSELEKEGLLKALTMLFLQVLVVRPQNRNDRQV